MQSSSLVRRRGRNSTERTRVAFQNQNSRNQHEELQTTAFTLCFYHRHPLLSSSISVRATCLAGCAQGAGRQQVQATSESETKRFCLVTSRAGAYGGCHAVMAAVLHSEQVAVLSMGHVRHRD